MHSNTFLTRKQSATFQDLNRTCRVKKKVCCKCKSLLTEQSAEELTLEDINHSIQGLMQLVVLLHQALFGSVLVLLPVVKLGPILLEKLQGSLGI